MMYKDEKARFFKILINRNIPETQFYTAAHEHLVAVPDSVLSIWKKKFYANSLISYPRNPRLINRFSIGADPEFTFRALDKSYIYANRLNLGTMMAFGADISGRQAELRAYPSRFVLDIVASLLDTLRWMAYYNPQTLSYIWDASGYVPEGDGCGGHIHFGRKRFSYTNEIKSLDSLSQYLMKSDSLLGAKERLANTNYGRANDFRVTSYGYEYRGISTWLNTPFLAYLALTLGKLSIFHDLSQAKIDRFNDITFVENILATYRYQDDDANIALIALRKRGSLMVPVLDMKTSWGISRRDSIVDTRIFIPPVIKPNDSTKEELFQHLIYSTQLVSPKIQPTWSPFKLKSNEYILKIPPHTPGLSEVCQGLISIGRRIYVNLNGGGSKINICIPSHVMSPGKFCTFMRINGINLKDIKVVSSLQEFAIEFPTLSWNGQPNQFLVSPNKVEKYRKLLLSGIFPIVDYKDYDKPRKVCIPVPAVKRKFIGKLL